MSNGTPSFNGLSGAWLQVANLTAVGLVGLLLTIKLLVLDPQREARFDATMQRQQDRSDERYDSLLTETLANIRATREAIAESAANRTADKASNMKPEHP